MLTTWGAGGTTASALGMRGRSFSIALALPIGRARVFLGSPSSRVLTRALETAGIIAEQLNVPITVDPCWPQAQETEMIRQRSQSFRLWIAGGPWPQIG